MNEQEDAPQGYIVDYRSDVGSFDDIEVFDPTLAEGAWRGCEPLGVEAVTEREPTEQNGDEGDELEPNE